MLPWMRTWRPHYRGLSITLREYGNLTPYSLGASMVVSHRGLPTSHGKYEN